MGYTFQKASDNTFVFTGHGRRGTPSGLGRWSGSGAANFCWYGPSEAVLWHDQQGSASLPASARPARRGEDIRRNQARSVRGGIGFPALSRCERHGWTDEQFKVDEKKPFFAFRTSGVCYHYICWRICIDRWISRSNEDKNWANFASWQ